MHYLYYMANRNRTVIQIRCSNDLKTEFKAIAAHFGSYEKALEAFVRKYNSNPDFFESPRII